MLSAFLHLYTTTVVENESQLTHFGKWEGNIEEFFIVIQDIFCHTQSQVCAVDSVFPGPNSNLKANKSTFAKF